MMDFLQTSQGQEFQDITLLVDGAPVSAHKVIFASLSLLSFFAVPLNRILVSGRVALSFLTPRKLLPGAWGLVPGAWGCPATKLKNGSAVAAKRA